MIVAKVVICLYLLISLSSFLLFSLFSSFIHFVISSFIFFPFSAPSCNPLLSRAHRCAGAHGYPLGGFPHIAGAGLSGAIVRKSRLRVHIGVVLGPELASIMLSLAFTYAIPLPLQPLRICVIGHGVPTRSNIKTSQLGLFIEICDLLIVVICQQTFHIRRLISMSNQYYWYSPPPGSYYPLPLPSQPVNYVYNVAAPRGLIDDRMGNHGMNFGYGMHHGHQAQGLGYSQGHGHDLGYSHGRGLGHSSGAISVPGSVSGSGSSSRANISVSAAASASSVSMVPSSQSSLGTHINFPVHQPSALPHTLAHRLSSAIYPTIEVKKYSTAALDPTRHFLTVFEYPLNGQSIIWDYESGYVHLTGIWKAAIHHPDNDLPKSNSKADIVKLLESTPRQHQAKIKRIRGGFLKIQGTWLPYSLCRILARRFCYHIRYQLIPVFDANFPAECFLPTDPGYGELKLDELEPPPIAHLPPPRTPPHAILAPNTPQSDRLVRFRHQDGSDLSYNEVVDIVNASKCLQSLSQSAQTSPISYEGLLNSLRDYVTGPENGISSILLAANLSNKPDSKDTLGLPPKLEPRRQSVKINDLLS